MLEEDFFYLEQTTGELYESTKKPEFHFALLVLRQACDVRTKNTQLFGELCLDYLKNMDIGLGSERKTSKLDFKLYKLERFANNALIVSNFDQHEY